MMIHRKFFEASFFPAILRLTLAGCLAAQPALAGLAGGLESSAAGATLKNVAFDNDRVTAQLDHAAPYRVFHLANPPRVVLELKGTQFFGRPSRLNVGTNGLKSVRTAQYQKSPEFLTRVVMDLEKALSYTSRVEGSNIVVEFSSSSPEISPASEAKSAVSGSRDGLARSGLGEEPQIKTPEAKNTVDLKAEVISTALAAPKPSSASPHQKQPRNLLSTLPKNPVTIDFDEADIRDVLRVLSEMCDINIIHGAEVKGTVTIHLSAVPFDEAFSTILAMQGLVAQQLGDNILRIMTPDSLSRERGNSVLVYKTFTFNYAKAADVVSHLSAVRIAQNARATVDERNNSLIVTDTPEGIAATERLISEIDKKPQQVMIEAKIVEIKLTDALSLGVQWEYANVTQKGSNRNEAIGVREFTKDATAVSEGLGWLVPGGTVQTLGPGDRGTGVNFPATNKAGITWGFINNTDSLFVTLSALQDQGKTKVLSEPKIITISNQEARIQSGSQVPYSTVTTSAGGTTTQNVTFKDVGIILVVTPIINADNRIRLKVAPTISSIGVGTVSSAGPAIDTKTADTEVLIRDGETLVIGGLITDQMVESASKVPIMGDIPVLGAFFRSNSNNKDRRELLVFVTPRIVRD